MFHKYFEVSLKSAQEIKANINKMHLCFIMFTQKYPLLRISFSFPTQFFCERQSYQFE